MIPEPLPIRRMDQIFDVISQGESGPKDPDRLYVGLEHIEKGGGRFVSHLNPSESLSMHLRFEPGDILFGKLRPKLRKSIAVDFSGYCSTDLIVLRPKDGIAPSFAHHLARSDIVFHHAISTSVGMGMPRTKWSQLSDLEVYCPNEETQCYIGGILDDSETVISTSKQLIGKLEMMQEGLLDDLLTYGIDEEGNLRSPETHDFVDSRIGSIPESWSVANLENFLSRPPKNGYSPVEGDGSSGIGMLGLGCLTASGFQPNQIKKAPEWNDKFESALLSDGDLLMSRSNTRALVGLAGIYRDIGTACIYPDTMMKLEANDRTSNQFLEYLLRCEQVRRRIQNLSRGTSGSMKKINGNIVQNFLVAIPPLPEQIRITGRIQAIDCRINLEAIFLEKYRKIKLGLMNDLLTGRVRVPTPAPDSVEVAA